MKYIFTILMTIAALSTYAASTKDVAIFDSANALFKEGNSKALQDPDIAKKLYLEAALKYKLLVDSGVGVTAPILMNLGNAYYFAGDNGRALLSYHRAALLDPVDADIQHNLDFVHSKCVDEIPDTFWNSVWNTIFFWHNLSFRTRLIFFALSFAVLWGTLIILLFRKSHPLQIIAVSAIAVSLILALSLTVTYMNLFAPVDGVIIAKEAQTYQGDAYIYNSAFLTPLHSGTEFKLRSNRGEWYNIQLEDNSTCWIPAKDAELIIPSLRER